MEGKGCDKFTRTWIIQFIPTHIYIDRNKKITPIVDMQTWICKFEKYQLNMLDSVYVLGISFGFGFGLVTFILT